MIARLFIPVVAFAVCAQDQPMPRMSEPNPADASPITPLANTLVLGQPGDPANAQTPAIPDLILIPGIGLSLEAWRPWMEANTDRYRMHAVTLPGMAGTAPPPIPDPPTSDTPFLDNAAAAIAAYIEDNNLDRPIVIGHGTGGMVAMLTGVRHSDLVGGVVSITMAPAVPIAAEPLTEAERTEQAFTIIQPSNTSMTDAQIVSSLQGTYFNVAAPSQLRDIVLADAARCEPHVLSQYWPEVVSQDLVEAIAANESLPVLICLPQGGPFRFADQWHAMADAADSIMLVEFANARSFCHYDEPERFEASLRVLIGRARAD